MKILYVSASVLPSQTADSVHVMKMSEALANTGNTVSLMGLKGEDVLGNLYKYYNVNDNFSLILNNPGKKSILRRVSSIIKHAKKADLVYTRYAIAAVIAGVLLNRNVIYEYHLFMDKKYNIYFENMLSKRKNVQHVFITKALMEKYQSERPRLKQCKCMVLPDGAIDPGTVAVDTDRKQLTCGYIGSFWPGKGIETVVGIANRMPDIKFHVVGGKPDQIEEQQGNIKFDNVVWHGYLDQRKAMEVLSNDIDIALLPNQKAVLIDKKESLDIGAFTSPMKLFEYMSYGKAIVASKLPVLEEIITDHKNALLVEADNIEDWVSAIIDLQNFEDLYKTIGKTAREDFCNHYTWNARARRVVKSISELKE